MSATAKKIEVKIDVCGNETSAGTIYDHGESITFTYNSEFLEEEKAWDLFPSLPRNSFAPFHFQGLGPFSDSAPDRWGRTLINRKLKRTRVSEMEYVLNVDDFARQGALRFFVDGLAVAQNSEIPSVLDLPEILNIADDVVLHNEISDERAERLVRATGSLGGARPKACVVDGGELYVAKFPRPQGEEWDVVGWEYVTLKLAEKFEIEVPRAKMIDIVDRENRKRHIMLSRRFDRAGENRIAFMSAMTALEAGDGEGGDWQDLVEMTREIGSDVSQLWLRAIFSTAIGNLDNHLRNHAYLVKDGAWELSPAYDMNPEPVSAANDVFELLCQPMSGRPSLGDSVTKTVTFKLPAQELFEVETKASNLGLSRSQYLRNLIAQDLKLTI